MKLTFLGTGTSTGIPQIACKCSVCKSADTRDKRLRASVLVDTGNQHVLIDCGPDFRQQMITHQVEQLTAVLITHEHYDHIGGLDDVRPFGDVAIYAEKRVNENIRSVMPYCFKEKLYPGVPKITLNTIDENAFNIEQLKIQPVRIFHAKLPILGFRIEKMAYLTDVKTIPDESFEQLRDLDVLILNALRVQSHISHITINEAIALAQKIGARKTYFTHFSHDAGKHAELEYALPENIFLAYDNLQIEF